MQKSLSKIILTTLLFVSGIFGILLYAPPAFGQIDLDLMGEARDQQLPSANVGGTSSDVFRQAFANLIGRIMSIVIAVGALMLLLYLIWGAFAWITSGGDKGKLDEARNRMTTAVIGIIVLASVVALFMLVQQILGVCVLDFWGTACGTVASPTPTPTPTP